MVFTTQRLDQNTLARVKVHGKMGETFDEVLKRILDEVE